MTLSSTPSQSLSTWRVCLMLCVIALTTVSSSANASLLSDRLEISMYGRMGLAWDPTNGRYVLGKTMNLTGSAIGGRLEEGDYLEPTIKLHLLAPSTDTTAPYVDFVLTPSMYSQQGLVAGVFSNQFSDPIIVQLFQAYIETGNILAPGLRVWGGTRFYRGTDVHIADTFYFNNLAGQGGGVMYGPLDLAIILQTNLTSGQYNFDVNGDGRLGAGDIRRQRTVFVAQYVHKLEGGHSVQGLAELHLLPKAKVRLPEAAGGAEVGLNSDYGWVAGIKGHIDLGGGSFNDLSFRYGSRAANGSRAGAQTFGSFGIADAQGRYDDASGIQAVEHFLYNFGTAFSLNAYAMLHMDHGLRVDATTNNVVARDEMDFGLGARGEYYFTDHLHLIGEASFTTLKDSEQTNNQLASAVKFTIAPTFVPFGGRSMWIRPHFRVFYTTALYNDVAALGLYSPYQQAVSESGRAVKVGHYVGSRVEWWF